MPSDPKILVYLVDDDASVRKAFEVLFLSLDLDFQIFKQAEDLLKCKLRKEKSCIIIDLSMEGMDGLELQRQLLERGIKIPIIYLTALESAEDRQIAKQAGAAGYLRKPVDDQALLDTIQWAISDNPNA